MNSRCCIYYTKIRNHTYKVVSSKMVFSTNSGKIITAKLANVIKQILDIKVAITIQNFLKLIP